MIFWGSLGSNYENDCYLGMTSCSFILVSVSEKFFVDNLESTLLPWGTAVAQWLRCCATNRKVSGSIPDGVIGIFH